MDPQMELYQQVILEHNKKPRNYTKMEHPTHHAEGYNPLCGDHLTVYLKVNNDDIVEEVSFEGDGCAISKASASLMTTTVKGMKVQDVQQLFEEFQQLVTGKLKPESDPNSLGKLKIFSSIWQYPARVKCAVLSWHAVKGALDNKDSVSTE